LWDIASSLYSAHRSWTNYTTWRMRKSDAISGCGLVAPGF
jgi:hypothetical protein